MKLRILVVRGSEWLRGTGAGYLMRRNKYKKVNEYCILGLALRELGVEDSLIERKSLPTTCLRGDNMSAESPQVFEFIRLCGSEKNLYLGHLPLEDLISNHNDSQYSSSDEERIFNLRPYMKKLGFKLVFRPDE